MRKGRTKHHMIPRSRSGSDNIRNLLLIHGSNHVWWHKVFGNRTFDEVIALLIRVRRAKRRQHECNHQEDRIPLQGMRE